MLETKVMIGRTNKCHSCGQLETFINRVNQRRWGNEQRDVCQECADYRDKYEIDTLKDFGYILETTSQKAVDYFYRMKYGKARYG